MENDFLGVGMKFPPSIDKATGRFEVSSGRQNVKESIHMILLTQKTERFMRPEFGTEIMKYTFMDTSNSMLTLLERELREDIENQEPRITDLSIGFDTETKVGVLFVDINYTVRDSNVRDNIVFPFYLQADVERIEDKEEDDIYEDELL